MITRILLSVAALCAMAIAVGRGARMPTLSRSGIELEFETGGVLSEAQIEIIRKLALDCGLPSVRKVYTYYLSPTTDHGIGALSGETWVGREYTYACIQIDWQRWEPGAREEEEVLKRYGDFLVRQGGVRVFRGATFATRRGEIRVALDEHTPLAFADRVVAAMEARPLRFKDESLKRQVEDWRADLTRPGGISEDKAGRCRIAVIVAPRPAGMALECVFDEDGGLTVVAVHSWIS